MQTSAQQCSRDLVAELEHAFSLLEMSNQKVLKLEQEVTACHQSQSAMQEEINQLKDLLDSSQTCSTSKANSDMGPSNCWATPAPAAGVLQGLVSTVSRLTDCKLQ